MLTACICGGAVEVGILACLVSGITCFGTSVFNRSRRVAHLERLDVEQGPHSGTSVSEDEDPAELG